MLSDEFGKSLAVSQQLGAQGDGKIFIFLSEFTQFLYKSYCLSRVVAKQLSCVCIYLCRHGLALNSCILAVTSTGLTAKDNTKC